MRYGPDHKAQSRERILHAAARELRAKGPGGLSVADVMRRAGLTHGGFYAHFASKEALVGEALDTMFAEAAASSGRLDAALADPQADLRKALRGFLASYLSPAHRDGPQPGCPLPALAGDMARGNVAAPGKFERGLARTAGRIAAALTRLGIAEPKAAARAALAQLVGAVALARALGKGAESDAILHDTLQALQQRLGL
jgi:TetR/AcrR family transcriptional repressor of nem operon